MNKVNDSGWNAQNNRKKVSKELSERRDGGRGLEEGADYNSYFSAHMPINGDLAAPCHFLPVKVVNLTCLTPN